MSFMFEGMLKISFGKGNSISYYHDIDMLLILDRKFVMVIVFYFLVSCEFT